MTGAHSEMEKEKEEEFALREKKAVDHMIKIRTKDEKGIAEGFNDYSR